MEPVASLPPAFWTALVLVAIVTAYRRWRGHSWDVAFFDGLRTLGVVAGAIILLGVLTYVSADPMFSLIATAILTTTFVLWRRHRAARIAATRCGKGLAPCIAG